MAVNLSENNKVPLMAINIKPSLYFGLWLLFSLVINACDKGKNRPANNIIEKMSASNLKFSIQNLISRQNTCKAGHGQSLIYLKRPAYGPCCRTLKVMMRM